MSKHTAGPWVAQGRDGLEVMGPTYRIVQVELDDPPQTSPVAYQTAQADARLIAAAPEMLRALRAAAAELAEFMPTTAGETLTMVEAAIAKAEGRHE